MKVLQINTVYGRGSTGRIAQGLHDLCEKDGIECRAAYRYAEKDQPEFADVMTVSSWLDCHVHNRLARYSMLQGCFSQLRTAAFLKKVSDFKPDLVHLHNLHGNYINLPMLFRYIKKHRLPVVWTLHDCWTFTGLCAHFATQKCDRWKSECHHCPQAGMYAQSIGDHSRMMHRMKKKWFGGIEKLTLVTPSQWLAGLTRESLLKEYPVRVISNGIDLSVFQPVESDFRKRYGLEDKVVVLGVAFGWGVRKGLDVFCRLAETLGDEYRIVLVGTNEVIDQQLPSNIISIHRTNNQHELAQIYTAADIFVNPTREEALGLVNIEALACGTPVITSDAGGSPEVPDRTCGSVVPCDDIAAMEKEVRRVAKERPYSREACIRRAKSFAMEDKFGEYIRLYQEIAGSL